MNGSLRDFDSPADRIRQHKNANADLVMVVEGPADARLLSPLLPQVVVFPVSGKANAISVTNQLREWDVENFLTLTDRDFDDKSVYTPHENYHIQYAGADMESMLVELGVLADVLDNLGSSSKIAAAGGSANVVAVCVDQARLIGRLRQKSRDENWGLNFDGVDVADKTERGDLGLDIRAYCRALRACSEESLVPQEGDMHKTLAEGGTDIYRGKDAIAVASVALRKKAGSLSKAACSPDLISSVVRSSATYRLSTSDWYRFLVSRLNPGTEVSVAA